MTDRRELTELIHWANEHGHAAQATYDAHGYIAGVWLNGRLWSCLSFAERLREERWRENAPLVKPQPVRVAGVNNFDGYDV